MSHAPYYHRYPTAVCRLRLRPYLRPAGEHRRLVHMAEVEGEKTALVDAATSDMAGEEEVGDSMKEG
jgi:hypothetical protein